MQKTDQELDMDAVFTRCNSKYNKWKDGDEYGENFTNHSLIQLYGYDIYRSMYCVFIYKYNILITHQVLTKMIEKDKQKSFVYLEKWFNEFNVRKHIFDEELSAEEILVLLVEEMGVIKTYHIFEDVLSKNIYEGIKRRVHHTDRTNIVCECDDVVIDSMYNSLKISEEMLNREQIKEVLSCKLTRSNGFAKVNNATLHVMGHTILTMLIDKYIIGLYLVEIDDFIHIRNLLVDANKMYNKVKAVMQPPLDLATERGFMYFGKNGYVNDVICMCTSMYIFKGIIALMFINCINDANSALFLRLMRFVKCYTNIYLDPLEYSEKDCQKFMCYFAVTNSLVLKAVVDKSATDIKHKMVYDVLIKKQDDTKKEHFKMKANAKKDVYGRILTELNNRSKPEWILLNELNIYRSVVGNASNCEVSACKKKKGTTKDNKAIKMKNGSRRIVRIEAVEEMVRENKVKEELKKRIPNDIEHVTKEPHPATAISHIRVNPPSHKRTGSMYDFNTGEKVLHVLKGRSMCARKKHNIINVTGSLVSLRRKTVILNVSYCKKCQRYFIYADDFVKYTASNGPLIGHLSFDSIKGNKNGMMDLAEESPLHMCGYSVNQQKKFTDDERHIILANIMNYNIMKKQEIIDYLHFYINNLGRRANMKIAVSKWIKDLDFVNKYKINKQKKVNIHRVTVG